MEEWFDEAEVLAWSLGSEPRLLLRTADDSEATQYNGVFDGINQLLITLKRALEGRLTSRYWEELERRAPISRPDLADVLMRFRQLALQAEEVNRACGAGVDGQAVLEERPVGPTHEIVAIIWYAESIALMGHTYRFGRYVAQPVADFALAVVRAFEACRDFYELFGSRRGLEHPARTGLGMIRVEVVSRELLEQYEDIAATFGWEYGSSLRNYLRMYLAGLYHHRLRCNYDSAQQTAVAAFKTVWTRGGSAKGFDALPRIADWLAQRHPEVSAEVHANWLTAELATQLGKLG